MEQQIVVYCPACGAEVAVSFRTIQTKIGTGGYLIVTVEADPPEHRCPNPFEDAPRANRV